MTDLKYDKIDNPEDKTQRNEEVKNSSIKKRVIIDAGIVALLIAGCVVGYAGYNYKQACSEHNQQVEVLYSKASDSVVAFKADPRLLTFEQRLDTIKNAQNNKEILNKEISNDSLSMRMALPLIGRSCSINTIPLLKAAVRLKIMSGILL